MRQKVKKALSLVPALKQYLNEKAFLDAAWKQATRERDAVKHERDQLQAAIDIQRDQLRSAIDAQRVAIEGLVAERYNLKRAGHDLQGEIDAQRVSIGALVTERDTLRHERGELLHVQDLQRTELKDLVRQVEQERHLLATLAAERDSLRVERLKYHHAVLGKLTILQMDCDLLGRNLTRLSNIPKNIISEELSRNLYLRLLEGSLTGITIRDDSIAPGQQGYDESRRQLGLDWPRFALTMIGNARMHNLRQAVETALREDIPGDFLEAGVWRGGACIYMRGILKAYGVGDRRVWAADSFAGLPPPNPERYPADKDDPHHTFTPLVVSLEEVRANFSNYDLLDEQVCFLKGWFKDTLPTAPVDRLAVLRLDGDMYESTIQTLDAMYRKLSPGGFVIIDDYILPACRKAVNDFRARHGIQSPLEEVDGAAVYWRKGPSEQPDQGSIRIQ